MLNNLKSKNPKIKFYSVCDPEFVSYGRVINGLDTEKIMKVAAEIENPAEGSRYTVSQDSFEKLAIADVIKKELYGGVNIQVGYCYGHNSLLNATEWHMSSEVNIAVTPLVLLLGQRSEIKNDKIDSSCFKAFYVPQGTVIEVYATTLHFCPCEVEKSGFGCVVALPVKTNIPLDFEKNDKLLYKYNKWVLAHADNAGMLANGAACGITGENYKINY